MKKILLFSLLPMLLLFSSCQKVIEFSGDISEPIVVLNSLVTPDSVVAAQVTMSRFFLSSDTVFSVVDNAQVSLFVNGTFKETLTNRTNGVYKGTYKPLVSDSIRLLVNVTAKNPVSGGTSIKPKVDVISVDTSSAPTGFSYPILSSTTGTSGTILLDTIGYTVERKMKFVLKFNDPVAERNYYRLVLSTRTVSGSKVSYSYSFSFDDVVSGNNSRDSIGPPTSLASNKYNVFSDDLINAKQYPLTFSLKYTKNLYLPGHAKTQPLKEVSVNLQSISRSYFLYLQTRANMKSNTFFAEPVQVYTNVDGGTGILGSYTSNVLRFTL